MKTTIIFITVILILSSCVVKKECTHSDELEEAVVAFSRELQEALGWDDAFVKEMYDNNGTGYVLPGEYKIWIKMRYYQDSFPIILYALPKVRIDYFGDPILYDLPQNYIVSGTKILPNKETQIEILNIIKTHKEE